MTMTMILTSAHMHILEFTKRCWRCENWYHSLLFLLSNRLEGSIQRFHMTSDIFYLGWLLLAFDFINNLRLYEEIQAICSLHIWPFIRKTTLEWGLRWFDQQKPRFKVPEVLGAGGFDTFNMRLSSSACVHVRMPPSTLYFRWVLLVKSKKSVTWRKLSQIFQHISTSSVILINHFGEWQSKVSHHFNRASSVSKRSL